jgi:hypothetical protein
MAGTLLDNPASLGLYRSRLEPDLAKSSFVLLHVLLEYV